MENLNNVKGVVMNSFYQKTIRIINVKNQTSAKIKQTYANQYSCNVVVMNSLLSFDIYF